MIFHYKRAVATATAALFLFSTFSSNPSYAAQQPSFSEVIPGSLNGIESLQVPAEFGEIQEVFPGKGKTVILIQDAHSIPDAQRSIQKLINHFQKSYGVRLVAMEGAASKADPQIFRSFPDREILEKTFDGYFEKGELAGGNAAAIFNEIPGDYRGVENWQLYGQALGLYLDAMGKSGPVLDRILNLERKLQEEKQSAYSKSLLEIDSTLESFHENNTGLVETIRALAQVERPAKGSEMELVLQESEVGDSARPGMEMEVKVLAAKVQKQLNGLTLQDWQKTFSEKNQAFQTSGISAQAFALYLKELIVEQKLDVPFPKSLLKTARDQRKIRDLEGTQFFKAFEVYSESVKAKLFRDDKERNLDRQGRQLRLLRNLARLEISREDWNEIKAFSGQRIADRRNRESESNFEDSLNAIRSTLSANFAFYENAQSRDQAFCENLIKLMENESSAMLIAGGFHSQGVAERLRAQGISYALVMPRINVIPDETHYRDHMRGDVSWKSYFEVERGRVNLYKAFVRATRDKLLADSVERGADKNNSSSTLNAARYTLKSWRDQIIRDLSQKGEIEKSGEYTVFLDETVQKKQSSKLQDSLARADAFLVGLRDLESKNQLTEQNILNLLKPVNAVPIVEVGGLFSSDSVSPAQVGLARPQRQDTVALSSRAELRREMGNALESLKDINLESLKDGDLADAVTEKLKGSLGASPMRGGSATVGNYLDRIDKGEEIIQSSDLPPPVDTEFGRIDLSYLNNVKKYEGYDAAAQLARDLHIAHLLGLITIAKFKGINVKGRLTQVIRKKNNKAKSINAKWSDWGALKAHIIKLNETNKLKDYAGDNGQIKLYLEVFGEKANDKHAGNLYSAISSLIPKELDWHMMNLNLGDVVQLREDFSEKIKDLEWINSNNGDAKQIECYLKVFGKEASDKHAGNLYSAISSLIPKELDWHMMHLNLGDVMKLREDLSEKIKDRKWLESNKGDSKQIEYYLKVFGKEANDKHAGALYSAISSLIPKELDWQMMHLNLGDVVKLREDLSVKIEDPEWIKLNKGDAKQIEYYLEVFGNEANDKHAGNLYSAISSLIPKELDWHMMHLNLGDVMKLREDLSEKIKDRKWLESNKGDSKQIEYYLKVFGKEANDKHAGALYGAISSLIPKNLDWQMMHLNLGDVMKLRGDLSVKIKDPEWINSNNGNAKQIEYYLKVFGKEANDKHAGNLYSTISSLIPKELDWQRMNLNIGDVVKLREDFSVKIKDPEWIKSNKGDAKQIEYYLEVFGENANDKHAGNLYSAISSLIPKELNWQRMNLNLWDVVRLREDFTEKIKIEGWLETHQGDAKQIEYYLEVFGEKAQDKHAENLYTAISSLIPKEFNWQVMNLNLGDVVRLREDFAEKIKIEGWLETHQGDAKQIEYYLEIFGEKAQDKHAGNLYSALSSLIPKELDWHMMHLNLGDVMILRNDFSLRIADPEWLQVNKGDVRQIEYYLRVFGEKARGVYTGSLYRGISSLLKTKIPNKQGQEMEVKELLDWHWIERPMSELIPPAPKSEMRANWVNTTFLTGVLAAVLSVSDYALPLSAQNPPQIVKDGVLGRVEKKYPLFKFEFSENLRQDPVFQNQIIREIEKGFDEASAMYRKNVEEMFKDTFSKTFANPTHITFKIEIDERGIIYIGADHNRFERFSLPANKVQDIPKQIVLGFIQFSPEENKLWRRLDGTEAEEARLMWDLRLRHPIDFSNHEEYAKNLAYVNGKSLKLKEDNLKHYLGIKIIDNPDPLLQRFIEIKMTRGSVSKIDFPTEPSYDAIWIITGLFGAFGLGAAVLWVKQKRNADQNELPKSSRSETRVVVPTAEEQAAIRTAGQGLIEYLDKAANSSQGDYNKFVLDMRAGAGNSIGAMMQFLDFLPTEEDFFKEALTAAITDLDMASRGLSDLIRQDSLASDLQEEFKTPQSSGIAQELKKYADDMEKWQALKLTSLDSLTKVLDEFQKVKKKLEEIQAQIQPRSEVREEPSASLLFGGMDMRSSVISPGRKSEVRSLPDRFLLDDSLIYSRFFGVMTTYNGFSDNDFQAMAGDIERAEKLVSVFFQVPLRFSTVTLMDEPKLPMMAGVGHDEPTSHHLAFNLASQYGLASYKQDILFIAVHELLHSLIKEMLPPGAFKGVSGTLVNAQSILAAFRRGVEMPGFGMVRFNPKNIDTAKLTEAEWLELEMGMEEVIVHKLTHVLSEEHSELAGQFTRAINNTNRQNRNRDLGPFYHIGALVALEEISGKPMLSEAADVLSRWPKERVEAAIDDFWDFFHSIHFQSEPAQRSEARAQIDKQSPPKVRENAKDGLTKQEFETLLSNHGFKIPESRDSDADPDISLILVDGSDMVKQISIITSEKSASRRSAIIKRAKAVGEKAKKAGYEVEGPKADHKASAASMGNYIVTIQLKPTARSEARVEEFASQLKKFESLKWASLFGINLFLGARASHDAIDGELFPRENDSQAYLMRKRDITVQLQRYYLGQLPLWHRRISVWMIELGYLPVSLNSNTSTLLFDYIRYREMEARINLELFEKFGYVRSPRLQPTTVYEELRAFLGSYAALRAGGVSPSDDGAMGAAISTVNLISAGESILDAIQASPGLMSEYLVAGEENVNGAIILGLLGVISPIVNQAPVKNKLEALKKAQAIVNSLPENNEAAEEVKKFGAMITQLINNASPRSEARSTGSGQDVFDERRRAERLSSKSEVRVENFPLEGIPYQEAASSVSPLESDAEIVKDIDPNLEYIKTLGQGDHGKVFLIKKDGRSLALKVPIGQFYDSFNGKNNVTIANRFIERFDILMGFKAEPTTYVPKLDQIYAVEMTTPQGRVSAHAYTMDYIEGKPLTDFLKYPAHHQEFARQFTDMLIRFENEGVSLQSYLMAFIHAKNFIWTAEGHLKLIDRGDVAGEVRVTGKKLFYEIAIQRIFKSAGVMSSGSAVIDKGINQALGESRSEARSTDSGQDVFDERRRAERLSSKSEARVQQLAQDFLKANGDKIRLQATPDIALIYDVREAMNRILAHPVTGNEVNFSAMLAAVTRMIQDTKKSKDILRYQAISAWLARTTLERDETPQLNLEDLSALAGPQNFSVTYVGSDSEKFKEARIEKITSEDRNLIASWDPNLIKFESEWNRAVTGEVEGFKLITIDSKNKKNLEGFITFSEYAEKLGLYLAFAENDPRNRSGEDEIYDSQTRQKTPVRYQRSRFKGVGNVLLTRVILESIRRGHGGWAFGQPLGNAGEDFLKNLGARRYQAPAREMVYMGQTLPNPTQLFYSTFTPGLAKQLLAASQERSQLNVPGQVQVYDETVQQPISQEGLQILLNQLFEDFEFLGKKKNHAYAVNQVVQTLIENVKIKQPLTEDLVWQALKAGRVNPGNLGQKFNAEQREEKISKIIDATRNGISRSEARTADIPKVLAEANERVPVSKKSEMRTALNNEFEIDRKMKDLWAPQSVKQYTVDQYWEAMLKSSGLAVIHTVTNEEIYEELLQRGYLLASKAQDARGEESKGTFLRSYALHFSVNGNYFESKGLHFGGKPSMAFLASPEALLEAGKTLSINDYFLSQKQSFSEWLEVAFSGFSSNYRGESHHFDPNDLGLLLVPEYDSKIIKTIEALPAAVKPRRIFFYKAYNLSDGIQEFFTALNEFGIKNGLDFPANAKPKVSGPLEVIWEDNSLVSTKGNEFVEGLGQHWGIKTERIEKDAPERVVEVKPQTALGRWEFADEVKRLAVEKARAGDKNQDLFALIKDVFQETLARYPDTHWWGNSEKPASGDDLWLIGEWRNDVRLQLGWNPFAERSEIRTPSGASNLNSSEHKHFLKIIKQVESLSLGQRKNLVEEIKALRKALGQEEASLAKLHLVVEDFRRKAKFPEALEEKDGITSLFSDLSIVSQLLRRDDNFGISLMESLALLAVLRSLHPEYNPNPEKKSGASFERVLEFKYKYKFSPEESYEAAQLTTKYRFRDSLNLAISKLIEAKVAPNRIEAMKMIEKLMPLTRTDTEGLHFQELIPALIQIKDITVLENIVNQVVYVDLPQRSFGRYSANPARNRLDMILKAGGAGQSLSVQMAQRVVDEHKRRSEVRSIEVKGLVNNPLKDDRRDRDELYALLKTSLQDAKFLARAVHAIYPSTQEIVTADSQFQVVVHPEKTRGGSDRDVLYVNVSADEKMYPLGIYAGRLSEIQRISARELAAKKLGPLTGLWTGATTTGLMPVQWIDGKTIAELFREGNWQLAYASLLKVEIRSRLRLSARITDIRENMNNIMVENGTSEVFVVDPGISQMPHRNDALYESFQTSKALADFKLPGVITDLAEITLRVMDEEFSTKEEAADFLRLQVDDFESHSDYAMFGGLNSPFFIQSFPETVGFINQLKMRLSRSEARMKKIRLDDVEAIKRQVQELVDYNASPRGPYRYRVGSVMAQAELKSVPDQMKAGLYWDAALQLRKAAKTNGLMPSLKNNLEKAAKWVEGLSIPSDFKTGILNFDERERFTPKRRADIEALVMRNYGIGLDDILQVMQTATEEEIKAVPYLIIAHYRMLDRAKRNNVLIQWAKTELRIENSSNSIVENLLITSYLNGISVKRVPWYALLHHFGMISKSRSEVRASKPEAEKIKRQVEYHMHRLETAEYESLRLVAVDSLASLAAYFHIRLEEATSLLTDDQLRRILDVYKREPYAWVRARILSFLPIEGFHMSQVRQFYYKVLRDLNLESVSDDDYLNLLGLWQFAFRFTNEAESLSQSERQEFYDALSAILSKDELQPIWETAIRVIVQIIGEPNSPSDGNGDDLSGDLREQAITRFKELGLVERLKRIQSNSHLSMATRITADGVLISFGAKLKRDETLWKASQKARNEKLFKPSTELSAPDLLKLVMHIQREGNTPVKVLEQLLSEGTQFVFINSTSNIEQIFGQGLREDILDLKEKDYPVYVAFNLPAKLQGDFDKALGGKVSKKLERALSDYWGAIDVEHYEMLFNDMNVLKEAGIPILLTGANEGLEGELWYDGQVNNFAAIIKKNQRAKVFVIDMLVAQNGMVFSRKHLPAALEGESMVLSVPQALTEMLGPGKVVTMIEHPEGDLPTGDEMPPRVNNLGAILPRMPPISFSAPIVESPLAKVQMTRSEVNATYDIYDYFTVRRNNDGGGNRRSVEPPSEWEGAPAPKRGELVSARSEVRVEEVASRFAGFFALPEARREEVRSEVRNLQGGLTQKIFTLDEFEEELRNAIGNILDAGDEEIKSRGLSEGLTDRATAQAAINKLIQNFVGAVDQLGVKDDLAIAFLQNEKDESFADAFKLMKGQMGFALLTKNMIRALGPELAQTPHAKINENGTFRRTDLGVVANPEAIAVVGNSEAQSTILTEGTFSVRGQETEKFKNDPHFRMVAYVGNILAGLYTAALLKKADELKNSGKRSEIRAALIKNIFNNQEGVVRINEDGTIDFNYTALESLVNEFKATSAVQAAA